MQMYSAAREQLRRGRLRRAVLVIFQRAKSDLPADRNGRQSQRPRERECHCGSSGLRSFYHDLPSAPSWRQACSKHLETLPLLQSHERRCPRWVAVASAEQEQLRCIAILRICLVHHLLSKSSGEKRASNTELHLLVGTDAEIPCEVSEGACPRPAKETWPLSPPTAAS